MHIHGMLSSNLNLNQSVDAASINFVTTVQKCINITLTEGLSISFPSKMAIASYPRSLYMVTTASIKDAPSSMLPLVSIMCSMVPEVQW